MVVHFSQSRSHFVGQCPSHDHNIRLSRAGTEHDSEPILIIPGSGHMHHLHSTTRQTERHGPHRTLATPIGDLVKCRQNVLYPTDRTRQLPRRRVGRDWVDLPALFCGSRTLSCVAPRSAIVVIGSFGFVENSGASLAEVGLEECKDRMANKFRANRVRG